VQARKKNTAKGAAQAHSKQTRNAGALIHDLTAEGL
jgi:hypothetical protein